MIQFCYHFKENAVYYGDGHTCNYSLFAQHDFVLQFTKSSFKILGKYLIVS